MKQHNEVALISSGQLSANGLRLSMIVDIIQKQWMSRQCRGKQMERIPEGI